MNALDVNYIVFSYSELVITKLCYSMFSTSRTEFSLGFAMYCHGLLVPKNKFLRRCGLIWKRKQHTFGGTFGQVNKNCPFSRV